MGNAVTHKVNRSHRNKNAPKSVHSTHSAEQVLCAGTMLGMGEAGAPWEGAVGASAVVRSHHQSLNRGNNELNGI